MVDTSVPLLHTNSSPVNCAVYFTRQVRNNVITKSSGASCSAVIPAWDC
uniref:Uncharacterized protein n=1 Tax=Anguilla anguilla TaxID=7936 RepID=A0A0E9S4W2_ANGAN